MKPFTATNREHWLTEAGRLVEPLFHSSNLKLETGTYRVTCGWPCINALGTKSYRLGECHGVQSSSAGLHELFISPRIDDPLDVLGTLCHELTHVAVGVKHGHDTTFAQACQRVGLTKGKPTSAGPGPRLEQVLKRLLRDLGPYPHSKLLPVKVDKPRRAKTVVKLRCECGCKCTMGLKWIQAAGIPTCGCGRLMMEVA